MGTLTDEQFRMLDAVCDRLVPTDSSGPGARQAGATTYIKRSLESDYALLLPLYHRGLRALDVRSRERHGDTFAKLDQAAQESLLRELESDPIGSDGRAFFEMVRNHAIEGMFGDPRWGGNRDHGGWELIGYRQPQLVWSAADQEITPLPSAGAVSVQGRREP